ncbi:MAG: hypothetical protein U0930_23440 [Pirellulales bacterium]
MSRIIDITVQLKLEVSSRLERKEFYDGLDSMLRSGLHDLLAHGPESVTVIAANDPESILSQSINLMPILDSSGLVAVVWSVEDVKQIRPDLSERQAMEVLLLNKRSHDANFGINWDTLSYAAELLYGEGPEPIELLETGP